MVNNTYGTSGSLTKASIQVLSPTDAKKLFSTTGGAWNEMTAWLKTQFEMQACGYRRNGFAAWLMSSAKGMSSLMNVQKRDRGPSLIQPYIVGRQVSPVSLDYWAISNGWATGTYHATNAPLAYPGTAANTADYPLGATTTGNRVIRVIAPYTYYDSSAATGSTTGVKLDAGWFNKRHALYILNAVSGAAKTGQWKVLQSAAASDGSFVDVEIQELNAGMSGMSSTPTNGIVLVGINNVNDYEAWCANAANYNPVKHVPFWFQTRRRTRRVDKTYLDLLARLIEDNAYFEQFYNLPIAERNRQDEENWNRQFVNSFLFGRKISANQTVDLWNSLDTINTAGWGSGDGGIPAEMVAKRANMIGVYDQLKADSRVVDMANQAVNIPTLITQLEQVRRTRKAQNRDAGSIDIYCDQTTKKNLEVGFINYTKAKYGDILRINIEAGGNDWGFEWQTVKFPGINFKINLIQSETFDDISSAFSNNYYNAGTITKDNSTAHQQFSSRGRFAIVLDAGKGGTVYPGVLGSNRKVRTIGEIETLAKTDATMACVMEHPTYTMTQTSETVTAIVEDPACSLWIEGIADDAWTAA